ncbi:MAG: SDR family oxidoreductase [Alphaproteobacteria bacterium]|nr:SDR family oxidoreductase [Rhodospirillaceae bacterium]MBT6513031.1 SDR family oxidoreductase [Rhodospirillaceae bacterium]MBT7611767.1 SDR family oxidoreductase [Rhodospirillaceae bacterium]MBT7647596.1 SDR family oxidoreductase [Rhodospirillaceae bacterium]MDG2482829.1 SDR family oxidoreductase [Alphaproteobacteria bacterium]
MRLKDKVAIVTGGASGIGRAIALAFGREGARVLIADIREDPIEGGEPTHVAVIETGSDALFIHCDVSVWADVDRAVTTAVETWGCLDIMVNNAATSTGGALLETTEEDWNHVMAVNATGVFFGCKRAVQQMLAQPLHGDARGRLINISSQHGMICSPQHVAYGTGKAAAVYLTRQVAVDYGEQGIICNAIAPGKILTGNSPEEEDSDRMDYARTRTAMPRLGRPSDIASTAVFLASDEATYITGHNLMVDGGWMAG